MLRSSRIMILALVCIVDASGCQGKHPDSTTAAATMPISRVVQWTDSVHLEENPQVVNVSLAVRPDPEGGYLIADEQESQFRRYGDDGTLLGAFGKPGSGPGEFQFPTAVVRLNHDTLLAVDLGGRASFFRSDTFEHLSSFNLPVTNITDVDVLSDTTLLLAGFDPAVGPAGPRLHVFDLKTGTVAYSFFDPMKRTRAKRAAMTVGWVKATVRHDTIATIFATLDTVYLFSVDGKPIASIWCDNPAFRNAQDPSPKARLDPTLQAEWASTLDAIANVYWLPSGTFVLPYETFVDNLPVWSLMVLARDGRLMANSPRVGRLFTVSGADRLVFQNPKYEPPNYWLVGNLRIGVRPGSDRKTTNEER